MKRMLRRPILCLASFAAAVLISSLLGACQSAAPGPEGASPGDRPAARPAAASSAPSDAPVAVLPARSEAEVRQILDNVRNLLDQGQEDAAVPELQRVLAGDAQHKMANSLLRQIRDDPQALYGRESFPYRVGPGDSLGSIAQRFMGDKDQFYGLARYNGLKVPRQIAVGQMIRVPGRAPRVMPRPERPERADKPEPPAVAPPPPVVVAPPPELPPVDPGAQDRERKAEVAKWSKTARSAMARQDLCGAISAWNQVLKIDPDNHTAALERDRALDLKKRLPSAKC